MENCGNNIIIWWLKRCSMLPCDKKEFFEYEKYEKYNVKQEAIPITESKRGPLYF